MIELLADSLFKSWKTTVVGLAVFGFLTYLGVAGIKEWEVLYGWYAQAVTLLFVADPKVLRKKKVVTVESTTRNDTPDPSAPTL